MLESDSKAMAKRLRRGCCAAAKSNADSRHSPAYPLRLPGRHFALAYASILPLLCHRFAVSYSFAMLSSLSAIRQLAAARRA